MNMITNKIMHYMITNKSFLPHVSLVSAESSTISLPSDITAHTVLLYVLFCLTYMYCTILNIVQYVQCTVHVSETE